LLGSLSRWERVRVRAYIQITKPTWFPLPLKRVRGRAYIQITKLAWFPLPLGEG
jgi:hypothetical protein